MNYSADGLASLRPSVERVVVVRTLDDFQRAAAIRAVVYVAGQECPWAEEFDGNDFCGLHLLGFVGDEPAGCLRIRFFAGFVKIERLAVLPAHRRSSLAARMVRRALQLARRKGYRRVYGHAREGLEPFWARFGARPMGPRGGFGFSGQRYTEMLAELPPAQDALALGDDPLVLIRPEGDWDRPGVLEPQTSAPSPAAGSGWSENVRSAWAPFARGRMPGFEEAPAHREDVEERWFGGRERLRAGVEPPALPVRQIRRGRRRGGVHPAYPHLPARPRRNRAG
jgi:predicted GNAT family N-acyltransferase